MTLSAQQSPPSSPSEPPPSPEEEFRDRLSKALVKAGDKRELDSVADSDVLEEGPERSSSSQGAGTAPGSPPTQQAVPAPTSSDDPGKRPQPRYDAASFGKWVQNNPEKAAELAAKVFKTQLGGSAEEWKKNFVALENKRRRTTDAQDEREQGLNQREEQLNKLAKEAAEPVQDILDVIEAEQNADFPAVDLFIEKTFRIPFDEYCRRRLRGQTKETATERAQKLKIKQLEEQLSKKDPPPEAKAPESKAPKVSSKWMESEIPGDHGVRDLRDWQARVEEAYRASYVEDDDEYGMSIEEAADSVLKEFLSKRAGRSAEPPQKQGKPKAKPKPKPKVDDDEDDAPSASVNDDTPPEDFGERTAWALRRANARYGR